MKAIIQDRFGPPTKVLALREVDEPTPRPGELLVRVHAAGVNPWDLDLVRGRPLIYRGWALARPDHGIPGGDVAGVVEATGSDVTRFEPGDAVMGDLSASSWGGFAQFVCVPETAVVAKPPGLPFKQAAAIPQAGCMALQALVDPVPLRTGQRLLINGAGGGVGSFAIQLAKAAGAEVTGVDSGDKADHMRSLGADHVVDYTSEDFTKQGRTYDRIVDVTAHRSMRAYNRVLAPRGTYTLVGGTVPRILECLTWMPFARFREGRRFEILAAKANWRLDELAARVASGEIEAVVDRIYPLADVPRALEELWAAKVQGKLVISIAAL